MNKDCLSVSDGSFILCWLFPCSFANTRLISSMQPLTSKGRVVAGFLSLLMRLGIHEKRPPSHPSPTHDRMLAGSAECSHESPREKVRLLMNERDLINL